MTDPTPPTNVQLELASGEWLPVDCLYLGLDGQQHVWRVVVPAGVRLGSRFKIDVFPAHTSIELPLGLG